MAELTAERLEELAQIVEDCGIGAEGVDRTDECATALRAHAAGIRECEPPIGKSNDWTQEDIAVYAERARILTILRAKEPGNG